MATLGRPGPWLLGLLAAASLAAPCAAAGGRTVRLAGVEDDRASRQAAELVRGAYGRIGIDAVTDFLPAERAVAVVNAGLYDGDVFHVAGMEGRYPNLVRVPVPIMAFEIMAFRLQAGLRIGHWEDLRGHTICIRRGIKLIEEHLSRYADVYRADSYASIYDMLQHRRCDVAVLPRSAWIDVADARGAGLREAGPVLATVELYHYVHASHAGDVAALAQALAELRKGAARASQGGGAPGLDRTAHVPAKARSAAGG